MPSDGLVLTTWDHRALSIPMLLYPAARIDDFAEDSKGLSVDVDILLATEDELSRVANAYRKWAEELSDAAVEVDERPWGTYLRIDRVHSIMIFRGKDTDRDIRTIRLVNEEANETKIGVSFRLSPAE